jgi:hypothetical protein
MFAFKVSLKPMIFTMGIGAPTEAMLSVVACGPLLPTGVPNCSAYTQRRYFALALLLGSMLRNKSCGW